MSTMHNRRHHAYILAILLTLAAASLAGMNIFLSANSRTLRQERDRAITEAAVNRVVNQIQSLAESFPDAPPPDLQQKLNRISNREGLLALRVQNTAGQTVFLQSTVSLPDSLEREMNPATASEGVPPPGETTITRHQTSQRNLNDVLLGRAGIYLNALNPSLIVTLLVKTPEVPAMDSYQQLAVLFQTFFTLAMITIAWYYLRRFFKPYEQLAKEIKKAPRGSAPPTPSSAVPYEDEVTFLVGSFKEVIRQLQEKERQLEEMNRQALLRADSSEKFARDILSSMRMGIITFDSQGHFLDCNPTMEEFLRRKRFALKNLSSEAIFQDCPVLSKALAEFQDTHVSPGLLSTAWIPGDGLERLLEATLFPLTDPSGRFYGTICVLEDVTESTRMKQQLQLSQNLAALGEMSAGIAHEFKNSLSTISGYAQMLRSDDGEEDNRKRAQALVEEVQELTRLISPAGVKEREVSPLRVLPAPPATASLPP